MSHHRRGKRHALPPCSALHEDDGVDPRHLLRDARALGGDRATDRLCGQAARLLTLALAGLAADEDLPVVHVVGVEPAPDASRLRVRVAPDDPSAPCGALAAWLEAVRPRLRAELAAGIRRRRAPDLVLVVDSSGRPA